MGKVQTIKFDDFMSGKYKEEERAKKEKKFAKRNKLGSDMFNKGVKVGQVGLASYLVPFVGATGVLVGSNINKLVAGPSATNNGLAVPVDASAVPVNAGEWMSETALKSMAHMLDPVIDILVALSFPIASVYIVSSLFLFMFNNAEKAWSNIQRASLSYVLIQLSPMILAILKEIGNAV
jgi:hypothetical protein